MGLVLKAFAQNLQCDVALKVIGPQWVHDEVARARFLQEARSAAALKHPNILTIHDVYHEHDPPFLVMECIRGKSLEMLVTERGRLEAAEAVRIARQMLAALECAHRGGVVHRDVKPANVLVEAETGLVKLVDFGLARGVADVVRHTLPGSTVGTPWYMAPEQITSGDRPDPRSDLFSVGVVLFEMLVGSLPFPGRAAYQVMERIRTEPAPDPCELAPEIPRPLGDIVLRALEKDPAARYFSAGAFGEALDAFLTGSPVAPQPSVVRPSPEQAISGEHDALDRMATMMPAALGPMPQPPAPSPRAVEKTELPAELRVTLPGGAPLDLVRIPAGEFLMGSPASKGKPDERPARRVRITRDFYLGKYEVTQGQYEAVMGTNPSHFAGDPRNPVECVSWDDAQEFCRRLRAHLVQTPEALGDDALRADDVGLPTEAQWEHACRAGTETDYFFGDERKQLGEYGWHDKNARRTTHPVGQLRPNGWNLHDLYGNVWEWCRDFYTDDYTAAEQEDPRGPAEGTRRTLRGGSWNCLSRDCRSAARRAAEPDKRTHNYGFRIVLQVGTKPS